MSNQFLNAASLNPGWVDRCRAASEQLADVLDRLQANVLHAVAELPTVEADVADWPDIRATLAGDGDAFARLVRRYQDTIAQQMWRFTRQQTACEELTHEVFVEAFVSLKRYRGDAPLVHWLRRIATRVGYRYYKRQASRRAEAQVSLDAAIASLPANDADSVHAAHEAAEAAAIVHQMLAQLPPRDRLVLTLMYLEGCNVAETGELIGWSKTMVKVQAHRARKKLKKLYDQLKS